VHVLAQECADVRQVVRLEGVARARLLGRAEDRQVPMFGQRLTARECVGDRTLGGQAPELCDPPVPAQVEDEGLIDLLPSV
jgi:hypothetical protein